MSALLERRTIFSIFGFRKGAIDNIGNLTACGDLHDLLFEKAKGEELGLAGRPIVPRNFDQSVVRRRAKCRFLEGSKPRPDRKPHGLHLIAPHVDVSPLFESECEHGLAVIKSSRANLEAGLLKQKAFFELPRFALRTLESGAPGKLRRCEAAGRSQSPSRGIPNCLHIPR